MKWYRNDHGPTPERREFAFKTQTPHQSRGSLGSLATLFAPVVEQERRREEDRMQTPEFWREVWGVK